jgi:hypothetical protein
MWCAVQEKRDGNVGSSLDFTHALYFFIASSPRFALIIFLLLFVGAKSPTSPTLIKIKCFSLTLSTETRTKDSQIKQSPFPIPLLNPSYNCLCMFASFRYEVHIANECVGNS